MQNECRSDSLKLKKWNCILGKEKPVIYDYLVPSKNNERIVSWTKWFEIIFLQTTVKVANDGVSEISVILLNFHQGPENWKWTI